MKIFFNSKNLAYKKYRAKGEDQNRFYSPYSLSVTSPTNYARPKPIEISDRVAPDQRHQDRMPILIQSILKSLSKKIPKLK